MGGVPSMALGFGSDFRVDSDGALSVKSSSHDPWSSFLYLVTVGNLEKVRNFLSGHTYKLSVLAGDNNLPMRLAAEFGHPDILEFLLENLYVKREIEVCENVALKAAVKAEQWGCAAILCQNGADIGVLSFKNQTRVQEEFEEKYGCACSSSWFNQVYKTVVLIFDGPSQDYKPQQPYNVDTAKKCKLNSSL